MRTILLIAGMLGVLLAATTSNADTVFLKNGEDIWGKDVVEEGDSVVIVRPGGDIRVPKAEVSRIERVRTTLPPFYAPPGPYTAPGPAGSPIPPAAAGGPSAPPSPPPAAAPAVPSPGAGATELPPPPAVPVPGTGSGR
jgi:hypothetical protein